jgi:hypothetical protein
MALSNSLSSTGRSSWQHAERLHVLHPRLVTMNMRHDGCVGNLPPSRVRSAPVCYCRETGLRFVACASISNAT